MRDLVTGWQAVYSKPTVKTFLTLYPRSSWAANRASLALIGIVGAVLEVMQSVAAGGSSSIGISLILSITVLVLAPVSVFVILAVVYGIGKLFGGLGTFCGFMYVCLLYIVPLYVAEQVINLLPGGLGLIANNILNLFAFYLFIQAVRAAHRFASRGLPPNPAMAGAQTSWQLGAPAITLPATAVPPIYRGTSGAATDAPAAAAASAIVSSAAPPISTLAQPPQQPPAAFSSAPASVASVPHRVCSQGHVVTIPTAAFCTQCGSAILSRPAQA